MATIHNALTSALKHHQSGRLRTAENIYRQVLEADAEQTDALHYLGLVYHQMGREADAIKFMRRAVELDPSNAAYHRNLGNVLIEQGESDNALVSYQRALELEPDSPETHNNLAALLTQQGHHEEALVNYQQALRLQPDYAQAHYNLGNVLATLGRQDEARRCYERALQIQPNFAGAHRGLGDLNRQEARATDAVASYQQALSVAWARRTADKSEEVVELCQRILEVDPNNLSAMELLAVTAMDERRYDDAIQLYERALAINPNMPTLHHGLASAHRVLGRFEDATSHYRTAIRLNPKCAEHYFNLSAVRKFTTEDRELAALEQLLAGSDLSEEERSFAHFAAGKMYDDLGKSDEAFQHFRSGNVTRRANFDCDDYHRTVTEMIRVVSADVLREQSAHGHETDVPVFVVGTPRSGTTLTEQILASHPEVYGAGELVDISKYAAEAPSHAQQALPYPNCLPSLRVEAIEKWSTTYLKRIREMDPTAKRIVDKHPLNFRHLGLIAMMFPNSRIIHCRRDPLDACLSMYFHKFRHGQDYSYSLTHLGFFYRSYRRLMDHWRAVLPLPMFELDYEQLVSDQEPTCRKLLDFCGLKWHDGCLNFHETQRAVTTASNWQVRHGMDKTRVKRWQKYENHLGALFEALGLPETEAAT